ncbi:hypothetical protein [Bacteroides heparinolyticus]|uniref:hypothetical protein n=1 Tax=Prevotella heparinolytica TaxID=28113 RepID=UPI0035A02317
MNAKQFFSLVGDMRAAQKEFFKTKSPSALDESKQLEKAVDAEVQRVNEIVKGQPIARDLFD